MSEIYWITRLDMINGWITAFTCISGVMLVISFIVCLMAKILCTTSDWDSDIKENKAIYTAWCPFRKWSSILFALFLPLAILVPDTKDAMLIWGVGTTIDYVKQNDTLKQIPDKCINALDAWVDSLNKEEKNTEE